MKHIASSLEHPHDEGVRAAAAKCVMALSRSIPNLRSSVIETEVAAALCRLLKDSSPRVQVHHLHRTHALIVLCVFIVTHNPPVMESWQIHGCRL